LGVAVLTLAHKQKKEFDALQARQLNEPRSSIEFTSSNIRPSQVSAAERIMEGLNSRPTSRPSSRTGGEPERKKRYDERHRDRRDDRRDGPRSRDRSPHRDKDRAYNREYRGKR